MQLRACRRKMECTSSTRYRHALCLRGFASPPAGTVAHCSNIQSFRSSNTHDCRLEGQGVALGDLREQERLARALFQHHRAGQHRGALALVAQCGAAWRAASLAGGGAAWVQVQAPGERADSMDGGGGSEEEDAAGALAADVIAAQGGVIGAHYGSDACSVRARWRAACAAVVAETRQGADDGSAQDVESRLHAAEAALYGALAGDAGAVVPCCACWEDEVWAHARCLLQKLPEEAVRHAAEAQAAAVPQADETAATRVGKKRPWEAEVAAGGAAGALVAPTGPPPDEVASFFLVRQWLRLLPPD